MTECVTEEFVFVQSIATFTQNKAIQADFLSADQLEDGQHRVRDPVAVPSTLHLSTAD